MSHSSSSNEEEDDQEKEEEEEAEAATALASASTYHNTKLNESNLLQLAKNDNNTDYDNDYDTDYDTDYDADDALAELPESSYKYRVYRSRSAMQLTRSEQLEQLPELERISSGQVQASPEEADENEDHDDETGDGDEKVEDPDEEDHDNEDNVDVDVDVDVDDDGTATTSYTYANESPSDYRPGGYHPVSVGDAFQRRYFAIGKLGWGHYSTVWLCYDTQRDRYCAIKLVKSAELYAEAARHEIRLLRHIAQLDWHPLRERLVRMTDSFSASGINGTHQCLVFEVLGENMLMLIQRSGYQGLPIHNVKQIAHQVLQGLFLLHDQGHLIHTDLKPENVLLIGDDVHLRTLANEASQKYLEEHVQQPCRTEPKLSKTARRRMRARTKQSVSFFRSHRRWLRERGIQDLLQLARRNLLPAKMAVDAVTNQLPYLPYDGPRILDATDLAQFGDLSQQFTEQVGDTAAADRRSVADLDETVPLKRRCTDARGSKGLRLLGSSTKKFLRYVQKCIDQEEKAEASDSGCSKRWTQCGMAASTPPNGGQPNLNLIARKDPALEPCQLQVAIADVGNACFIDDHVTEDIQTREYRAIEVILGAGYDTSADLWSAACLFWELATGEYLFEPNKWRNDASPDEVHVAHIIETCGPIPKQLIDRGQYSAEIFDADGQLLNIRDLESHPLEQVLMDRYNWSLANATEFADFLMPMLCTDPERRVTAFTAINHPWLILDEEPPDDDSH